MVSFTHRDPTPGEDSWLPVLDGLPGLADVLPEPPRRLVVLAAHPDDESLGAGGLIASLAAAGTAVDVVVATAGEASHPDSPTHTPQTLTVLRETELRTAVGRLAPNARVHLLGLPDGQLAAHRAELDAFLAGVVGTDTDGLWLAAPWRGDGHTDHDAAGAAAARLAAKARVPLLEYPIWLWHWGTAADLPEDMHTLALPQGAPAAKAAAMGAHRSQVAPLSDRPGDEALLAPEVLAHFARPFETFKVTVPRTGKQVFEDLYAASPDPWNFGDSFYERRKRDLTLALLPRERFGRVFEPGCSIGVLTAELARRAESVTAMDISARALELARQRIGADQRIRLRQGSIPEDWPDGSFDLVVLSEIGYFLSREQLRGTVLRAAEALDSDGVLLLCHWRHPIRDWPMDGDEVHEVFRSDSGLELLAEHCEADFRIDVLVHPPARSVADREGLL
ncbi:methyltransferase domain-containing protein [Arthrobacter yangruifuii]|uniref:Methyltransferase domain-containing protein n=1 Tax=Arthrobacter yangruifuii TaxID=2606616 RepID=A0A5N6MDZ4_9MICC|nr:PIG-L family deacetylase [Arthrobacter yangruifuii]KAD3456018.1 methyltransferase domain-containing protein [Arthrobacter yangruifuii]